MFKYSPRRAAMLSAVVLTSALAACTATLTFVEPPGSGTDAGVTDSATGADAARPFASEFRALLEIEHQRLLGDPRMAALLAHAEPSVALRAIEVAGRTVDAAQLPTLIERFNSGTTPAVRAAAAAALYGFDPVQVRTAVLARASAETSPEVLAQMFYVLSKVGVKDDLALIDLTLSTNSSVEVQAACTFALARLFSAAKLVYNESTVSDASFERIWAALRGPSADYRAFAARLIVKMMGGTNPLLTPARKTMLVDDFQGFTDEAVRLSLAVIVRRIGTPAALATLKTTLVSDPSPSVRAGTAWEFRAGQFTPEVLDAYVSVFQNASNGVQAAVNAARALTYFNPEGLATRLPLLDAVYNNAATSKWLRAEMLPLLVLLDAAGATARVNTALTDSSDLVRAAAVSLAAARPDGSGSSVVFVGTASNDLPVCNAAHTALGSILPAETLDVAAAKQRLRDSLASGNEARIRGAIEAAGTRKWADLMPEMIAATTSKPYYLRQSVLKLAEAYRRNEDLAWVDTHIEADEPWVGRAAAAAHKAITGEDVSARVRTSLKVKEATPSDAYLEQTLAGRFEFETSRGTMVMKSLSYAPLTLAALRSTVTKGEYEGLRLYRHEPGQLFQFGSPTFHDTGNTVSMFPRTVRSTSFRNRAGTVGNGRQSDIDDEGSTLFFNLVNNDWIDLDYTPVGELSSGLNVMQALELGDTVLHARFIPAAQ